MAAVIRRRKPASRRSKKGLVAFAHDRTSQNGEDGIIERIFQLLPLRACEGEQQRFCVDVGAWDGRHLSNTFTLLNDRGWKGLLIEADAGKFQELQALHAPLGNVCVQCCVSCEDVPRKLPSILDAEACPKDMDFLSIDIDSCDYWLLVDTLEAGYSPAVICIEFNPTMPDDLIYIPPRTDRVRHGCSLAALCELAQENGYVLVETTIFNAFFVRKELYEAHLADVVPDTSIEALHKVTMGTSLYQLYDGTIKLHGCKMMLWHRVRMDEAKMQMVPHEERAFPFAPQLAAQPSPFDDSHALLPGVAASDDYGAMIEKLRDTGFAYVSHSSLSHECCARGLDAARTFFSASEAQRRTCLAKDRAKRGYAPMCTENFASLLQGQSEKPNDRVRKFRVGPLQAGEGSLRTLNVWGSFPQTFRGAVEDIYEALSEASIGILSCILDGLCKEGLLAQEAAQAVKQGLDNHASILTLLGYKQRSKRGRKKDGGIGSPLVQAHTDVGLITVLFFDQGDCAKLQRKSMAAAAEEGGDDSGWIDVKLPDVQAGRVLVVNIGDCLCELTDGSLPSTVHRVVSADGEQSRHCLALFVNPDPETVMHMKKSGPITYGRWRHARVSSLGKR